MLIGTQLKTLLQPDERWWDKILTLFVAIRPPVFKVIELIIFNSVIYIYK